MADRPLPPAEPGSRSPRTGARIDAETGRPGIANADVPSESVTTGLPDVGAGASASHFARDAGALQQADDDRRGEGPGTSDKRAEG